MDLEMAIVATKNGDAGDLVTVGGGFDSPAPAALGAAQPNPHFQ